MSGQRVWRAKDQSAPYIPQPDYTPLPARRTNVVLSGSEMAFDDVHKDAKSDSPALAATLPRLDDKAKPAAYLNRAFDAVPESFSERAWNSAHWSSSQFSVSDWNVALMQKQLCHEAKTRRDERIRSQADKTLESFEKEMDLYLDDEEAGTGASMTKPAPADSGVSSVITPSQSSSSLSSAATGAGSLPRAPVERLGGAGGASPGARADAGSSPSSTSGSAGRTRPRDRDQISLESGYMSSYPGDAQRHHHQHNGAC